MSAAFIYKTFYTKRFTLETGSGKKQPAIATLRNRKTYLHPSNVRASHDSDNYERLSLPLLIPMKLQQPNLTYSMRHPKSSPVLAVQVNASGSTANTANRVD